MFYFVFKNLQLDRSKALKLDECGLRLNDTGFEATGGGGSAAQSE